MHNSILKMLIFDGFGKSLCEALDWHWKKFDIRGVVFFEVSRLYM